MENGELVSRTEARAIMMAEGGAGDALMAFSISCSFNGEPETTVILVVGVREDGFLINAVTVWLCEMAVESISLPVLPEAPRRRICIFMVFVEFVDSLAVVTFPRLRAKRRSLGLVRGFMW